MAQELLKCPEKGCNKMVKVFTGPFLITQDQRNLDRSCPKHREKYALIEEKNRRFVEMVNRSSR
jgi:hypothetical protein